MTLGTFIPLFILMLTFTALSAVLVKASMNILRKFKIVDVPSTRRFNTKVKPRGAGIILIPLILLGWIALGFYFNPTGIFIWVVPLAATLLLAISILDDVKTIPAKPRFIVQIIACMLGIYALDASFVFQGYLPFWLDRSVAFLALLWFTNLYNFMDGVDGITGMQTTSLSIGIATLMLAQNFGGDFFPAFNFIIAGSALGFLIWNWAPSRILIGDSGSIPLGFIMGWMLLYIAGTGYFWAAGLIALYYCMDATTTLIGRIMRREKILEPHRLHFFHRPVPHAYAHNQIVKRIFILNIILFACAHWTAINASFWWQAPAILLGLGCTIVLMLHFYSKRQMSITKTTTS